MELKDGMRAASVQHQPQVVLGDFPFWPVGVELIYSLLSPPPPRRKWILDSELDELIDVDRWNDPEWEDPLMAKDEY